MDITSSAINGPFYLTNTLPIEHPDLQDSSGQIAGGGVSVYFSHILQLIFFSYSQGTVMETMADNRIKEQTTVGSECRPMHVFLASRCDATSITSSQNFSCACY